ncbi:MAG: efflux RND transporter permease subunit [Planctomycetes bacterium]|nr:efflux RND transporter permease subunit [Planctomycetota bacterium]
MRENWLAKTSVAKPVTATMILCAIVAVGGLAYNRIPVQLLPGGYSVPFLFVRIPYRDGTPREVEKYVTRPAEEALATVANVETMSSRSGANETRIWIGFTNGTDMDVAYSEVRDRMDRAMGEFPDDVERYSVFKYNPNSEAIMEIAISYPEDEEDLTRLERKLSREIERIPGVAKLEFEGLVDESIRIEVDRDKARAHGINLYRLVQRLRTEDFTMGAGTLEEGGKDRALRSVAMLNGAEDVAALPVGPGLKLGDVADVHPALSWRDVISRIDGKPAITLEIYKESEGNTVETCAAVRHAVEQEFPADPELRDVRFFVLHDSGTMITESIDTLKHSALQGAFFSLVIVFVFLLRFRLSLIINLAIPAAFLITLIAMYFTGDTLNLVSLMGLTLAIGMLVDNSVVVSENIDRLRAEGLPPARAAVQGASEVSLAVTLSTLTTVVVFLPLALMSGEGMMQFFMGRLAIPVCVSLLASLFVSLALVPAASAFLAGRRTPRTLPPVRWAAAAAAAITGWCLRHRLETALAAAALLASAWWPYDRLEKSMEPKEQSNNVEIFFRFSSTGGLSDVNRNMKMLEAAVDAHRAELQVANVRTRFRETFGRMTLYLDKRKRTDEERKKLSERVRAILPVLAGVEPSASWRGGEGKGGEVQVQLTGEDSEVLADLSEEVKRRLKALPGVEDVKTDLESGNDEIRVRVRRDRAARAGIDSWVASGTVSTALRGSRLPDLRVGDREVPLILQFPAGDRENLTQLGAIALYPPGATSPVPLSTVADFEFAKGLAGINHENRKTSMGVTVVASGSDTMGLSNALRAELDRFSFPRGYGYDMGSWSRRWRREEGDYGFSMAMSVVFVFLLMGILFESWVLPFSVLGSIPFSFAGVYWFLWLTHTTLDLMGMIGIVVLVGVVVNNAIVLVDRILHLRAGGMDRLAACREATRSRFRPIWITALTTIVGLVPMAFGESGIAGVPYAPLARTVMGGLLAATVMTLFIVPVMYTVFDDLREMVARLAARVAGRR